jgi:peptidoglycan/LPS O-acetylase OafA/YrhL
MTNAASLYLDVLRFSAAFTVFLSHYAVGRISGALFWQVADYGRTAVLVFFVLSGFVIAWVTETREEHLEDYALSRIARLYSVIIPAFVVTAALNSLWSEIDPRLYGPEWGHSTPYPISGYLLSVLFLGESWTLRMLPGRNVPFWSLNYEAWYYILFGAAVFLRGRRRLVFSGLAALLAGPKILLLFPIWLMGVGAWRYRAELPRRMAGLFLAISLIGLVVLEGLGGQRLFWHPGGPWMPPGYSAYDYLIGALMALLLVGLVNTRLPVPGVAAQRVVRWVAGTTFGLYLLHFPLLNFCATVIPGPVDGAMHRILVFALALAGSIALGRLIEQRKGSLKRVLASGFDALLGIRPASTIERRETS